MDISNSAEWSTHRNILGATKSLWYAFSSGYPAWITKQENLSCNIPIRIKNPKLNRKENWKMSYGTPCTDEELKKHKFFNKTQKELTLNYEYCFRKNRNKKRVEKRGFATYFWEPKNGIAYNVADPKILKAYVVRILQNTPQKKWQRAIATITKILVGFIPSKSILRMNDYTCYRLRFGTMKVGIEIEFTIPKRKK